MALVYKDLNLDLSQVPDDKKDEVKREVSNLLYNEVLRYVGDGKSPVAGEPSSFKILNKKYADQEKQGNRKPNLQLEGDMLRDDFEVTPLDGDTVRVGHFDLNTSDTEGEKADGHNHHSPKAKAWALPKLRKDGSMGKARPKRRYIPDETQTFKQNILDKVNALIGKYKEEDNLLLAAAALNQSLPSGGQPSTATQTTEVTAIGIDDFLSDEYLAELIGDRLDL